MKIITQILSISFLLLMITSCSDFQKVVKGDDYEEKFLQANRFYDNGSYTKALTLYEQIYQRLPNTDKGQVSYYRIRSEEHTSELQSRPHLVCRLLLEKKKEKKKTKKNK